jgi:thioredoxin-related protein
MRRRIATLALLALAAQPVLAAEPPATLAPGMVNPGYHEPPAWFKESFLDLREDVAEAARAGRRLMLYFYQDGCPYCARLLRENFGDRALAEKTRKHFDVIAINLWGDREVTDLAGATRPEKAFARSLKVQFTPTLVMLDEGGKTVLRLNGLVPPHKFDAALDYAGAGQGRGQAFTDFLLARPREAASGRFHDQAWLLPPPLDLARQGETRPLMVLFEQQVCAACDELHGDGFARPEMAPLLAGLRAARVDIASGQPMITPAGERQSMAAWARQMGIVYTPSLVFFDTGGQEIFRVEGYLRRFHLAASLDYVVSGAYRSEPEFQRFIEARAAARRARGEAVNLMR